MQSQTEKAALTITPKILNSYGTTSNQEIQLWASRKIPLTIMMVRDLVKVLGPLNPLEQGYADFGITTLTASLSTCVTQLEAGDHDQIMFAFIEALNQCVHALERSPSTIITTFPCIPTHAEAAFKHQTHAVSVINIQKAIFIDNGLNKHDLGQLIGLWTTIGLEGRTALACKCLILARPELTKGKQKTERGGKKQLESNNKAKVTVVLDHVLNPLHHTLTQNTRLSFPEDVDPPQHLYFFLEVTSIINDQAKQVYMGSTIWPFQLELHGTTYTIFACGFWNRRHYWCKVLQSGEGDIIGVWLHANLQNDGLARMVNKDPQSLGGALPLTSWVMYSRAWTLEEEEHVTQSSKKIVKDHPKAPGEAPFVHLSKLLQLPAQSTRELAVNFLNQMVVDSANQSPTLSADQAQFNFGLLQSKRVKPTAKLFNPEGERVEALDGDLFECPEESIHPNLRSAKPAEDLVSTPHKLVIPPEVLVLPPEEPVIPPRVLVLCPEELFIPPEVLGKATETVLKSPAYSVQFAEDSVKLPDLDQIKTEEECVQPPATTCTYPVWNYSLGGVRAWRGNSQLVRG
ncbi:hypothetical protein PSTG_13798 [Puccinia striiformis f. sp. tritici PST-78]|uniref:Uncharacterized protein n=1 Tax=Puccinia striiformis f. sp. tritici PST-78 TaxID=1165861 RepID=A0A0L0V0K8_9BASI|nr:hypothetical protein PSTG_13798 [Puccinia striiformis f. sp. tritici PST-78]